MPNPEDKLIDDIDRLVDWQMTESPAAYVETGGGWSQHSTLLDAAMYVYGYGGCFGADHDPVVYIGEGFHVLLLDSGRLVLRATDEVGDS